MIVAVAGSVPFVSLLHGLTVLAYAEDRRWRVHVTTIEGRRLVWDAVGGGEAGTFVALPGMGDLRSSWSPVVRPLIDAGWRVVTVDVRGHGDSDLGFARYAPDAVGADVLAVIADVRDRFGAGRTVVAGNSASAAAAVWAAAEAPHRIDGLVLLGPVVRDPSGANPAVMRLLGWLFTSRVGAWLWGGWYRFLHRGGTPAGHDAHVAAVVAKAREPGRMAAAWSFGTSPKAACADRVGEVRAPVLLVMGDVDPDFPDAAKEAHGIGALLRAEVHVLPGVGHYPHRERAGAVADLVLGFLGRAVCRAA